jgi:hypothetical protein
MRVRWCAAGGFILAALSLADSPGFGGVVVTDHIASVTAESLDPTVPGAAASFDSLTDHAPIAAALEHNGSSAAAELSSTLIFASGEVVGHEMHGSARRTGDDVVAGGNTNFVFEVFSEPVRLTVRGGTTGGAGTLSVYDADVPDTFPPFSRSITNDAEGFDVDLVLPADSRYSVSVNFGAPPNGEGHADVSVRVAAVPLPPAAWAGLLTLGICGGVRLLRGRGRYRSGGCFRFPRQLRRRKAVLHHPATPGGQATRVVVALAH